MPTFAPGKREAHVQFATHEQAEVRTGVTQICQGRLNDDPGLQ